MVRSIDGHGSVRTSRPVVSSPSSLPSSSTTLAEMPGNGVCAEPGLRFVTPGSGLIMCAPVSVCHQVSTIGQRPPPMFLWYQSQASGLIGSPTDVGGRPVDVAVGLEVEAGPVREGDPGQVAAAGVQYPLGLRRRARRV